MSNVFFSSDHHFSHRNIIKYSKRLIFCNDEEKEIILNGSEDDKKNLKISDESVKRMDEGLIERWNSVVKPNDTIYHLGDFCFNNFDNIFPRLNGKIIFIEGNHDKLSEEQKAKFAGYHKILETVIFHQRITMCHYCMKVWNKSHAGSWHLWGHSHGSLPDDPNSLSIDVGVDCHHYYPISFHQIQKIMKNKTFKQIDHHGKNV